MLDDFLKLFFSEKNSFWKITLWEKFCDFNTIFIKIYFYLTFLTMCLVWKSRKYLEETEKYLQEIKISHNCTIKNK